MLLAAAVVLQSPSAQSYLAKKFLNGINKTVDGRISVGRISLKPFNTLFIEDLLIMDDSPLKSDKFPARDTLAYIKNVSARFSLKGLVGDNGIMINKVYVRDGFFHLVTEGVRKSNVSRFTKSSSEPKPLEDNGKILLIRKFDIRDFRFTLNNAMDLPQKYAGYGFDWTDLDVTANIEGHDFRIADGAIGGIVDKCEAREKHGFNAFDLTGTARVSRGLVYVSDFHLLDPWSDAHFGHYSMEYESSRSFQNYTDEVTMELECHDSRLDWKTLAFFIPGTESFSHTFDIESLSARGTVNDMNVKELAFREKSGVKGNLSCTVKNTEHPGQMAVEANIRRLDFTTENIGGFLGCFLDGDSPDLGGFAKNQPLCLKASGKGLLNDLSLKCNIASHIGSINAGVRMRGILHGKTRIEGFMDTHQLDLGKVFSSDALGECTSHSVLKASLGEKLNVALDTLEISSLTALNHEYGKIGAEGRIEGEYFNAKAFCADSALNLILTGNGKIADGFSGNISLDIGHADLHAMNLDNRGKSEISLSLAADIDKTDSDGVAGSLLISDINVENDKGAKHLGNLKVTSGKNNGIHETNLDSPFLRGRFRGTGSIGRMISDLKTATVSKDLSALTGTSPVKWPGEAYDLKLNFGNSIDLMSYVLPGLYIADSTVFQLSADIEGQVDADLNSSRLAFENNYMKGFRMTATAGTDRGIELCLHSDETAASSILLADNTVGICALNDSISFSFSYDNGDDPDVSRGGIRLDGRLSRDGKDALAINAGTSPSDIIINSSTWHLMPSRIHVGKDSASIEDFKVQCGNQFISLDGGISAEHPDTAVLEIKDIDIHEMSRILGEKFEIAGIATGRAIIISPVKDHPDLLVNLNCDSTAISGHNAGTLKLGSAWDDDSGKLNVFLRNFIDGKPSISAHAAYSPVDGNISALADLDGFNAGYAESFLQDIFSELGGRIYGHISAFGKPDSLILSSRDCRLEDSFLKVGFTNVRYDIEGPFHIDNSGIILDGLAIRDGKKGRGTAKGGLRFQHLKDIRLDADLHVENLEAINIGEAAGGPVYGHASLTGNILATGPLDNIFLDVTARTSGASDIHVPLNTSLSSAGAELLTFKEDKSLLWIDPYEEMISNAKIQKKEKNNLSVRATVNVTPDLECTLNLDDMGKSGLAGAGAGLVKLNLDSDNLNLSGDYTLSRGKFNFAPLGLTNKEFSIKSGSYITFGGSDILDSEINIEAIHDIRTSLANLITDTTSVSSRRSVQCGIHIFDKLRNPQLGFSIDIPDLDPYTRSLVQSALNTNDKVQKQFLSLLITGSFLPSEQSGIVNNTNLLYSNVANIMATQLNNILQMLEIPLDLGFSYQSSEGGTDIFDVAVSTQLFNNRVSVNGAIGNRRKTTDSGSDVAGDLDIEVKLDKRGAVKMKLFSHSADQYTNYLDNSQRNGVGIEYSREFNTIKEFIRNLFSGKEKRRQREMAGNLHKEIEKTIIHISDDGN